VHINNLNIKTISRDIFILKNKYNINNFEFINYFPFDKPFENKKLLEYDFNKNRLDIDNLFKTIKLLKLKVNFYKFSKDFFINNIEFYNFEKGIVKQIGSEDIERLSSKKPFCFIEKRCNKCFIKDNCKFYAV
jgi:hypothetical protein